MKHEFWNDQNLLESTAWFHYLDDHMIHCTNDFQEEYQHFLKTHFRTIILLGKFYFRDLTLKIDNFILFIYINTIQTDVEIPACDWLNQCVGFYQLRRRKITEFRFEIKEMIVLVWRRHRKNKINFIISCWFEEIKALCCLKTYYRYE